MRDWVQIFGVACICILMMFAMAAILDNPDRKEAYGQMFLWMIVLALIISQAIW